MKVQFLITVGESKASYGRGGWYDTSLPLNSEGSIPIDDANYYISKGMAKIIEADKPVEVKKEVRPLKPEKKKKKKAVKKPASKSKKVSTRPVK